MKTTPACPQLEKRPAKRNEVRVTLLEDHQETCKQIGVWIKCCCELGGKMLLMNSDHVGRPTKQTQMRTS
ncbi:hypothetical protein E2320_020854 [Naja naja]|nr:hypothetical protein E2320_020854 [Naja naja]